MSVFDINKVDAIGFLPENNELGLLITDQLSWDDEYNHLVFLQSKINSYLNYIEDKQYNCVYPDIDPKQISIHIAFKIPPSNNCLKFLDVVRMQLPNNILIIID